MVENRKHLLENRKRFHFSWKRICFSWKHFQFRISFTGNVSTFPGNGITFPGNQTTVTGNVSSKVETFPAKVETFPPNLEEMWKRFHQIFGGNVSSFLLNVSCKQVLKLFNNQSGIYFRSHGEKVFFQFPHRPPRIRDIKLICFRRLGTNGNVQNIGFLGSEHA